MAVAHADEICTSTTRGLKYAVFVVAGAWAAVLASALLVERLGGVATLASGVFAVGAATGSLLMVAAGLRADRAVLRERAREERRRWIRAAEDLEFGSARLEEALERERTLRGGAIDAMMTLTSDGVVESLNPSGERAFETVAADVVGRSFESLVEFDDGATLCAVLIAVEAESNATPRPRRATAYRADGVGFPVEVTFVAQPGPAGLQWVVFVHDISDRERVMLTHDRVIAEAGHKLRTPLASITGALGLLRAEVVGRLPKPAQNLVAIAHANVQVMTDLVGQLLEAESTSQTGPRLEAVKFDLRAVFEQAVESAASALRSAEIRVDVEPSGPVWARGDAAAMGEVARRLLDGARGASAPGGVLRVAFAAREDVVQVCVQHDGQAAPAEGPRAFSRFAQPDGPALRRGGGADLALCKAVVDQQGGRMFVTSEPGRGTRVYLDMPAFADDLAAGADTGSAIGVPPPRVLICEDDPEVCELLRAAVKVQGGEAEAACNLHQAEAALATGRFDLLICDLRLPDGHGLELLRRAAPAPADDRLPVIILSAEARQPFDGAQLGMTIVDWLEKPIRLGVLRRAIRDAFDGILGIAPDRRPTILHVEDDPDVRRLVHDLLQPTGDVVHAESLFEARRRLATGEPDLIVLDIGLRDGSGLELMPLLTNRRGERIPTIIFSGRTPQGDLGEGVDHVFTKSRGSLEALAVRAHLLIGAGAERQCSQYEAA